MIVEIIYNYLQANKRLVVPNLGAFIVKQGQDGTRKVLFSNLIKNDDGVLRALLIQKGVSELEAAGVIDRFVFEVNHRLDLGNVCALDGFGTLKRGANGAMSFVENQGAKGEVLDGNFAERLAERQAMQQQKAAEAAAQQQSDELEESDEEGDEEMTIEVIPSTTEHSHAVNAEQTRRVDQIYDQEPLTASTQKRPASYVKGLRYGKGGKIITGREYATSRKSSSSDLIMKIAIGAAVIAMLALGYGMWGDWRTAKFDREEPAVVETDEPHSTAEKGIENPDLQYIQKN